MKLRANRKKRASKVGYNAAKRWLTNKVRKLERHVKVYVNDKQGQAALDRAKSKV